MRFPLAFPLAGALCIAASVNHALAGATILPTAQPTMLSGYSASVGTLRGDVRAVFRKKFKNAIKINATKEMERLIRSNLSESAVWIVELAHAQVIRPLDTQAELFAQIETTWKKVKRTEFPAEMRRFYESLQGDQFKLYANLTKDYNKLVADYYAELNAEGGPKPNAMVDFANRFDRMTDDFDGMRCDYYASQCAAYAGVSWDKDRAKDLKDLKRACTAYGRMIESRERMGLKDSILTQAMPRYNELVSLGYGPGSEGPAPEGDDANGGGEPGTPGLGAASNFTNVPLNFELLEGIEQFQRPNYFVDEHYPLWHSFYLREVGSTNDNVLRFGPMIKKSGMPISARRKGSAKLYFDMDGDEEFGEKDIDIPVKGKRESIHLEIPVEGRTHHVAFYVQTGQEKDKYQGLDTNLQPSDTQIGVYATPAGSMVGTIGGESIRIIDEDMDGVYGGKAMPFGHVGLTESLFQPEFDSMVIGGSKRALPWSRYALIGKQWYDLKSENDGTSLGAAPVTLKTGFLQLKFKGPKPAFVIVQGTGSVEEAFFDLSTSSKVEVPTGNYKLLVGMIKKGKKQQLQKVLMIPGSTDLSWNVGSGETVKVELGGPFKFDFGCDADSKGCQVIGTTVAVVGAAGERYERPWLCVPRPKASGRKAGAKRGTKAEKMGAVTSTEEVSKKGWVITWFPKDMGIDIKNAETSVEVQLTQKKHPLFGKITSDWLPFER
ncbi:MAG: hypothetical protein P1V35_09905 [Planctomycetota bacterium]|nr:hypothetical protein [Planctomycetota bacterium]